jgi:hypothetical protein
VSLIARRHLACRARASPVPASSGTAERSLILQHLPLAISGLVGAGGLGAATYFDPESWQRNVGVGTLGLVSGRRS